MAVTAIPISTRVQQSWAKARARVNGWEQRARRSLRVTRARAGYAAGMTMAAWGVGVVFGFGWALIAGGVVCAYSFLHLYDVDESP